MPDLNPSKNRPDAQVTQGTALGAGSDCSPFPTRPISASRRRIMVATLLGVLSLASACAGKKAKGPRVVSITFRAHPSTNEGRPMTVVVQESGLFASGPPVYDDVVQAAAEGTNVLGQVVVYPGHDALLRLSGIPVGTQIIVSALYTTPTEKWQRQIQLGSRTEVVVRVDMQGILP
jgi:hypothetical protein